MINLGEILRLALSSIAINRTRAALTMLGIIIGVGSVIGLISLGEGVDAFVRQQFQSLGANVIVTYSSKPESDTRTRIEPLTTEVVDELSNPDIAPNLLRVGAAYSVVGTVSANGEHMDTAITGVSPNLGVIRDWFPQRGQYITPEDDADQARVAVLGIDVVEELYGSPDYDPLGERVRLNNQVFTVVGVMEERGGAFGNEDGAVFVPLSTAQTKLADARGRGGYLIETLYAQAVNDAAVDRAVADIDRYLYNRHEINFDGEQDYTIVSQNDIMEAFGSITGLLTVFLGVIAGVSLLVGGIGIMNIMLVTVTERTREIGLRKAVGAQGGDILAQFLMESLTLSLLGGIIGIGLGWLIIFIGSLAAPTLPLRVTPGAILLATGVSSFVGIAFGLFPANRAARMRPIDALRSE